MHYPQIDIFYPTYKNIETFAFVLRSCLTQDYQNIKIHVYDNAFSEGYLLTSELIEKINDRRIIYHKNLVNMGATINYAQIIAEMKKTSLSICLAADIGFTSNGLSLMVDALFRTKASIVFPSSYLSKYEDIIIGANNAQKENYFDVLEGLSREPEIIQPGIDLVKEYFSEQNISGEYNNFSFFGALISSPILHALGSRFFNYKYHGFEHYLSMDIATKSNLVSRLSTPCLMAVVGTPRIGGTERPTDHFTRLETIIACSDFLKNNYFTLKRYFKDMNPFFISQIDKCFFFKANYVGYEDEINKLILVAKKQSYK